MLPRLLLSIVSIAVFFTACKKDDTPEESTVVVEGIPDSVYAKRGVSVNIPLDVINNDRVSIITHLMETPVNVTWRVEGDASRPGFNAVLSINTFLSATPGDMRTSTFRVMESGGKAKKYPFVITVITPTDCAQGFAGKYSGSDGCDGSDGDTAFVRPDPASSDTRVRISNLGGLGRSTEVYAELNCNEGTLIIPQQTTTNGFSISGDGTYMFDRFSTMFSYKHPDSTTARQCGMGYIKW